MIRSWLYRAGGIDAEGFLAAGRLTLSFESYVHEWGIGLFAGYVHGIATLRAQVGPLNLGATLRCSRRKCCRLCEEE